MAANAHDPQGSNEESRMPAPIETFAAATALGFAMAQSAFELWLGVVTGIARAGQEGAAKRATPPAAHEAAAPSNVVALKRAPQAEPLKKVPVAAVTPVAEPVAPPVARTVTNPIAAAPVSKPVAAAPVSKPVAKAVAPKPAKPKPAKAEARSPEAAATAPIVEAPKPVVVAEAPAEPQEHAVTAVSSTTASTTPSKPAAANAPEVSAAVMMPEDFRRPQAMEKPASPDDLKQIPGVGPKLEKVLNGLGIWTYAQIGALEPAEIAWVDDYLGLNGRIARDGWAAQAAKLSKAGG